MIKITSAEEAARVTNDQLPDVHFDTLLETYRTLEFMTAPASVFTVLLCLMCRMRKQTPFTFAWVLEHVGPPAYYAQTSDTRRDLFYVYSRRDCVGCVAIREGLFDGFSTIDWPQFEAKLLPHLKKWDDTAAFSCVGNGE
jgi:hypothetical protein